ncbi:MAG: hypothetical protein M3Y17_01995 [Actinomycetota bacterium]|nr:hypothetical protein [Actinomycetota bacterium]
MSDALWRVELTRTAQRDLRRLDPPVRARVEGRYGTSQYSVTPAAIDQGSAPILGLRSDGNLNASNTVDR